MVDTAEMWRQSCRQTIKIDAIDLYRNLYSRHFVGYNMYTRIVPESMCATWIRKRMCATWIRKRNSMQTRKWLPRRKRLCNRRHHNLHAWILYYTKLITLEGQNVYRNLKISEKLTLYNRGKFDLPWLRSAVRVITCRSDTGNCERRTCPRFLRGG